MGENMLEDLDNESLMELLLELEKLEDVCDELVEEEGAGNEELR